ncbi:major centromere autoantigen B-like [Schistocerca cancellata]|uniref:major centromere autoantigen B-like n=1 Tax=Schistocerca cancellata TaxID=274614 RepID=UPI0021174B6B|nr:major centromere autoantigen B-like [Schistocerca cancellata]
MRSTELKGPIYPPMGDPPHEDCSFTWLWNVVTRQTVINCFANAGCCATSFVEDDIPEEDWNVIDVPETVTFQDFILCDDNVLTSTPTMDMSELFAADIGEKTEIGGDSGGDEDDDDDENVDSPTPSFSAAVEGLESVRRYFSSFIVDESVLNSINQLERQLLGVCCAGRKQQTTLLDFFSEIQTV